ncbi:MAG: S8 family peptidase [Candidatus Heimdallarchaeaceae archaeon]
MKRKAILSFSILLLTIFMIQISAVMVTPTQGAIVEASPSEDAFIDSVREFVVLFKSEESFNNYVSEREYLLAFPYLKMVAVEDMLSNKIDLLNFEGVKRVFDVTNTEFQFIKPVSSSPVDSSIESIKLTVATADQINVSGVWDMGYDGAGTVVYDIDTGINELHEDFTGKILPGSMSFVNESYGFTYTTASINDENGHGTHTAGTAAGAGIANPNYKGMAPGANILVGRVGGAADELPIWGILASLEYALEYEATVGEIDVINMSLGSDDQEGMDLEETLVQILWGEGMFISNSAGNYDSGESRDYISVGSASSAPQVVSVAAVDSSGTLAAFSVLGPTADGFYKPDIAAPGVNIVSCATGGTDGYVSMQGTSMAAPHITGAAAVMIEALKDLGIPYTPGMIKAAMMMSADPKLMDHLGAGAGIPDIGNALQMIIDAPTNATGHPSLIYAIKNMPTQELKVVPQGWHHEFFVESVSATPWEDLTPVLTGDLGLIGSIEPVPYSEPWTKFYKFVLDIPTDLALGDYSGNIVFETSQGVQALTHFEISVTEGKGRIYFAKQHTSWAIDGYMGQYFLAIQDLIDKGIAINEYRHGLVTAAELVGYDAIWFADPFDYDFPNMIAIDQTQQNADKITARPLLDSEVTAIQDFVASGGGLFIDLLGQNSEQIDHLGASIIGGNNITMVNNLIAPYDITVSEDLFDFSAVATSSVIINHALTDGVIKVDHYGTTLTVAGDANILTKWNNKGTTAAYENDVGGRVVIVTTNFHLDSIGYKDAYNSGTQNKIFANNIFNWFTADEKLVGSYVQDTTGADVTIESLNTSATLSATVKIVTPIDETTDTVTLTEDSPGMYSYRLTFGDEAAYTFKVESGDDIYIADFLFDSTPPEVLVEGWTNDTKPEVARLDFEVKDYISNILSISVKLNEENIDTLGAGKIRTFVIFVSSLVDGDNDLHIVAVDLAGNTLDVHFNIPTTSSAPVSTFAILLGILSLAAIATFIRRKKH